MRKIWIAAGILTAFNFCGKPGGISWEKTDLPRALAKAGNTKKQVLVYFYTEW